MTPPAVADWLLRRALPPGTTGLTLLGDLREEFHERAAGGRAARTWYWGQALTLAWHYRGRARGYRPWPTRVTGGSMFDLRRDLLSAWRLARQAPGHTALVVLTLAAAIGATTVAFAFVDQVTLQGLPVADPGRTVIVYGADPRQGQPRGPISLADFLDYRERVRGVRGLAAWGGRPATLAHDQVAEAADVAVVTGDVAADWGLSAALGRLIGPGDDAPGAPRVVVLSHAWWQREFGASPEVLGERITVDGEPHTIVGVMAADMEAGNFSRYAAWVPLPLQRGTPRDARTLTLTARLAEGTTSAAAAAEFAAVARTLASEHPATNQGRTVTVLPAAEAVGGENFWTVMALLLAAVGFVMAIACANVAGMLLARATAREREVALRAALGAGRLRLVRQMLVEGLCLGAAGGLGGLVVAEGGLRLIRSVDSEPFFRQIRIDPHELLFVAALALIAPVLFSLAPALKAGRVDLRATLNAGGARSGATGGRGRGLLVIAQVALAVTLVTAAGLAVRTAINLSAVPPGFDASRLLVFGMDLDEGRYPTPEQARLALSSIEARVAAAAGVAGVAAIESLPAVGTEHTVTLGVDGLPARDEEAPWAQQLGIEAGTLGAMGVPVLAGRGLTDVEVGTDAPLALVSRVAADRYLGGVQAALGRRVVIVSGGQARERQVVGVTGDVRAGAVDRGMPPRLWIPLSGDRRVSLVVRTSGDPLDAAPGVREAMREAAPGLPMRGLEPYGRALARRNASDRIVIGMFAGFAVLALVLAGTGLYGLVAYSVSRRRAEFGTRFALGARVGDVLRLVLREATLLLAGGLTLGLAGGLLVARGMRGMFYGVGPADPINVAVVVALLVGVTLAASLGPALRASRVDPLDALRAE
ncbi:MAG: ADOP family duplicated permease [Vicinamibacterales bacterium]